MPGSIATLAVAAERRFAPATPTRSRVTTPLYEPPGHPGAGISLELPAGAASRDRPSVAGFHRRMSILCTDAHLLAVATGASRRSRPSTGDAAELMALGSTASPLARSHGGNSHIAHLREMEGGRDRSLEALDAALASRYGRACAEGLRLSLSFPASTARRPSLTASPASRSRPSRPDQPNEWNQPAATWSHASP